MKFEKTKLGTVVNWRVLWTNLPFMKKGENKMWMNHIC